MSWRRRLITAVGASLALVTGGCAVAGPGSGPGSSPGRAGQLRSARAVWSGLAPHRSLGGSFSWVSVNGVNGLAAVSADDVWAVGSVATGRPLIERWNGKAWKQVPSASPRDAKESLLTSVAATRPSTAWAVGYYNNGSAIKTLIEQWNGRAWTLVASPSPGGPHGSFLYGVAATGPSSAWAVGSYGTGGNTTRTLIERWDGKAWRQFASPSPGGVHDSAFRGVAAGTSGAWAVGYYYRPSLRPLIERWDGRAWTQVASPNPGGCCNTLNAVTTTGGSGAWAAGSTGRVFDEALIERWNGRSWSQVASPRPAGSRGSNLTAIAALSAADVWAAGYYYADTNVEPAVFTLIERWNGRAWKQEPSPNPGGTTDHLPDQSALEAVCAVSPSKAWAAGSYSSGNPHGKILFERRAGRTWTQVPAEH